LPPDERDSGKGQPRSSSASPTTCSLRSTAPSSHPNRPPLRFGACLINLHLFIPAFPSLLPLTPSPLSSLHFSSSITSFFWPPLTSCRLLLPIDLPLPAPAPLPTYPDPARVVPALSLTSPPAPLTHPGPVTSAPSPRPAHQPGRNCSRSVRGSGPTHLSKSKNRQFRASSRRSFSRPPAPPAGAHPGRCPRKLAPRSHRTGP